MKALAFNRHRCCHLALCLWLILFQCTKLMCIKPISFSEKYKMSWYLVFCMAGGCMAQFLPNCQSIHLQSGKCRTWRNQWGEISWQFLPPGGSWFPDMAFNFYSMKNHKIAKNSTTARAREKMSTFLESLEFYKFIDVHLAKFKNNQILL